MRKLVQRVFSARRRAVIARGPRAKALRAIQNTGVVFIHIPKCGGKSVVRDLYGLTEHEWFGHAGVSFYRSVLGEPRFSEALKFAFVRDPVTRCYSGFQFAKRGGFGLESDQERCERIGSQDFETFVLGGFLEEMAIDDAVFRPQAPYIFFPNGVLGVDRVCAFEKFAEEMAALPLSRPVDALSHVNAAPSPASHDIPAPVRARIAEIYAVDYRAMAGLEECAPAWATQGNRV